MTSACQQVILFNIPPPITVHEMTANLPCLDVLWEAKSGSEFCDWARIYYKNGVPRAASLRDSIDALMRHTWCGLSAFPLQPLQLEDMHCLVLGKLANIAASSTYTDGSLGFLA
jgi:hypothetical protein